jgi:hypothetical protein
MGEWIALTPGSLNDIPVGMWEIVNNGRQGFGLEGEALATFIRRSIYALMDAGAKPVRGVGRPGQWNLQVQYGSDKHEVAEAVIQEWLREGAPTPKPWTGLWFGLPRSWLEGQ